MDKTKLEKLSKQFIEAALHLKKGEKIWIEYQGMYAQEIAHTASKLAARIGAEVHMVDRSSHIMNSKYADMSEEELIAAGREELEIMKTMDAYIRIDDPSEAARVAMPSSQMALYKKHVYRDKTDERVRNTRWLVTTAYTPEFATLNNMSEEAALDYYMKVNTVDYSNMSRAAAVLEKYMTDGRNVRIKGAGTDISFSIADIPAVACTGRHNIPDGECFTAPVKESVNGTIQFGPSVYDSERFESIALTFENGKVVEARAENEERTKALNAILDTDEGGRYIGEFAIAFNPYILEPTGDILFDEKIMGSLHFALGACYDEASNGNSSAIHWDMVHIQRPEHGGGEIWIDDELIRKDGQFVPEDLQVLNPDELIEASQAENGWGGGCGCSCRPKL